MKKYFLAALLCLAAFVLVSCEKEQTPAGSDEAPCPHTLPTEKTVVQAPTETMFGEAYYICPLCGQKVTETIPYLNENDYTVTERTAATCEEDGKTVYYSEKYGTYTVYEEKLGHMFVDEPVSGTATCEKDGFYVYPCVRCPYERKIEQAALGHNYVAVERYEGDCYEKGYVKYVCDRCSDSPPTVETDYKHDFVFARRDDGDCAAGQNGFDLYLCDGCGREKKVFDQTPTHVYNKDSGVCERCGAVCPHSFEKYVCVECGFDIEKEIARSGIYYHDVDGDGEINVGEKVYFGSYPQSHVGDKETVEKLDKIRIPGESTVEADGVKYEVCSAMSQPLRGVTTFSDGTPMAPSLNDGRLVHYFRYEPIAWTAVKATDEETTFVSDFVLLCSAFREKVTLGVNGNDWEQSAVRVLLNGDFYETAFTEKQKNILGSATLNNAETGYYDNEYQRVQKETEDSVFLPAFLDLYDKDDDVETIDEGKRKAATDYLVCSGKIVSYLYDDGNRVGYWLRSVGKTAGQACVVTDEGFLSYETSVDALQGVSPAIILKKNAKK